MTKISLKGGAIPRCLVAVIFSMISLGAYAMGGFGKVMFSEVQGVVLKNGQPVSGAKVIRKFHWAANGDRAEDQASTDAAGKFAFPLVSRTSILRSLLPHEPVIYQDILIQAEGNEYIAWRYTKHDYDENGELNGKKINIKCELTQKKDFHINRDIYGICVLN